MELITPNLGLLVWTVAIFLSVLFILSKFAWNPIVGALEEREKFINDSLAAAERAKSELAQLQVTNEKLLQEARLEKDKILKEAQVIANTLISEAKNKAECEANLTLERAKNQILAEKNAAVQELKNLVAVTSIEIAEKILKQSLQDKDAQRSLIEEYLRDTKFN